MNLFPPKMKPLIQDLSAFIAEKSTQNTKDQKSLPEIEGIYQEWALSNRNPESLKDFNHEISTRNKNFQFLIGCDPKYHNFMRISVFYVDLHYYTSKDKVYARFFKTIEPLYAQYLSDKKANILFALPEFIWTFANPEGLFVLEQMTFKNT